MRRLLLVLVLVLVFMGCRPDPSCKSSEVAPVLPVAIPPGETFVNFARSRYGSYIATRSGNSIRIYTYSGRSRELSLYLELQEAPR